MQDTQQLTPTDLEGSVPDVSKVECGKPALTTAEIIDQGHLSLVNSYPSMPSTASNALGADIDTSTSSRIITPVPFTQSSPAIDQLRS
jgi:hypothetical protein